MAPPRPGCRRRLRPSGSVTATSTGTPQPVQARSWVRIFFGLRFVTRSSIVESIGKVKGDRMDWANVLLLGYVAGLVTMQMVQGRTLALRISWLLRELELARWGLSPDRICQKDAATSPQEESR